MAIKLINDPAIMNPIMNGRSSRMSTAISEKDMLKLPERIAKLLKGKKIEFVEMDGGVFLHPIDNPIAEARGMLKGKRFTSQRYLSIKKSEKEKEK
jgi:hypothetical protein